MNNKNHRPVIIWLLSGCFLIFLMVVIGGITRLTHSGLSMVEWNLIMGSVPPMSQEAWQAIFEKYKQFPEYKELNYHFTLDDFKSIFWWEYIHRMLGRLIGVVFILPFIYFLLKKRLSSALIKKLVILFLLGAFQGFLGWFMVKSGLVKEPRVSHYRLAAHLITAFLTFGYTFWIALDLIEQGKPSKSVPALRSWARGLFWVLLIQIVYGAFVAGLRAGTMHNTFPLMDGQLVADAVTAMDPLVINFIEGKSGVQFIHRYLAYLVVFVAGVIWWKGKRSELLPSQQGAVHFLGITVVLQFVLGVLTLLYSVPVTLGVLHQAGAFFLLTATLLLLHRLKTH